MKEYLYIMRDIGALDISLRDKAVLTLIRARQETPESLNTRRIADSLKIGKTTVKDSFKSLRKKGFLGADYSIKNIDPVEKGFILHLYEEVMQLPDMNLNARFLLSLISEKWVWGYFNMKSDTIKERLGISRRSIHRFLQDFESRGWVTIEGRFFPSDIPRSPDGPKRYRKVYVHQDKINSDRVQKQKGQNPLMTQGLERCLMETVEIENGILLNRWVHEKRLERHDAYIRKLTARFILEFMYFGEFHGFPHLGTIPYSVLLQYKQIISQNKDRIEEIAPIWFNRWFSGEVDVTNLPRDLKVRYEQSDRSLNLFTAPLMASSATRNYDSAGEGLALRSKLRENLSVDAFLAMRKERISKKAPVLIIEETQWEDLSARETNPHCLANQFFDGI